MTAGGCDGERSEIPVSSLRIGRSQDDQILGLKVNLQVRRRPGLDGTCRSARV